MSKKLLRSRFVQGIIARAYHRHMLRCMKKSQVEWVGRDIATAHDKPGTPCIVAFWHGRMALMPFWSTRPWDSYVMISRSGDGQLITSAMEQFGLKSIRGSTNNPAKGEKSAKDRGGTQALREGVRLLKEGKVVAVTPDGPRGPRMRAQIGVITLAQLSGAPILPLSFSASKAKIFSTWDKFTLPYGKGNVVMMAGEPLYVPREADETVLEGMRKILEDRMNKLARQGDEKIGRAPIEPAEPRG